MKEGRSYYYVEKIIRKEGDREYTDDHTVSLLGIMDPNDIEIEVIDRERALLLLSRVSVYFRSGILTRTDLNEHLWIENTL